MPSFLLGPFLHFNPCKTCRTRRRWSLLCASSMRKGRMEATTEAGEGNCRTSRGFPSASCQAMRLTFFQRQLWQTTKRPDGSPKEKHTPGYFHVKMDELIILYEQNGLSNLGDWWPNMAQPPTCKHGVSLAFRWVQHLSPNWFDLHVPQSIPWKTRTHLWWLFKL